MSRTGSRFGLDDRVRHDALPERAMGASRDLDDGGEAAEAKPVALATALDADRWRAGARRSPARPTPHGQVAVGSGFGAIPGPIDQISEVRA